MSLSLRDTRTKIGMKGWNNCFKRRNENSLSREPLIYFHPIRGEI